MNAFANFKKNAAATTPAAAPATRPAPQRGPVGTAPAYAPRAGKYSGLKAAAGRDPMPQPGDYVFRVVKTYETTNPKTGDWYHAQLEVLESNQPMNPAGSVVSMLQATGGKALAAGGPRVKSFVMASAGFDDEAAYDEMDPDGQFIDATAGAKGCMYTDGTPIVDNPLGGRLVRCRVSRGKDDGKGDFYREYAWTPVAEEDQAAAE